ncbi:hypothetical protein ACOME3_002859 [Neoechinorhynchus agilis]
MVNLRHVDNECVRSELHCLNYIYAKQLKVSRISETDKIDDLEMCGFMVTIRLLIHSWGGQIKELAIVQFTFPKCYPSSLPKLKVMPAPSLIVVENPLTEQILNEAAEKAMVVGRNCLRGHMIYPIIESIVHYLSTFFEHKHSCQRRRISTLRSGVEYDKDQINDSSPDDYVTLNRFPHAVHDRLDFRRYKSVSLECILKRFDHLIRNKFKSTENYVSYDLFVSKSIVTLDVLTEMRPGALPLSVMLNAVGSSAPGQTFGEDFIRKVLSSVVDSISLLHEANIVAGSISCGTVLIGTDGDFVICAHDIVPKVDQLFAEYLTGNTLKSAIANSIDIQDAGTLALSLYQGECLKQTA